MDPMATTRPGNTPRRRALRGLFLWPIAGVGASLATPEVAQAYLDPATGSMIIQAVIGAALGALFVIKTQWRRLKAFFSPESKSTETDRQADGDA